MRRPWGKQAKEIHKEKNSRTVGRKLAETHVNKQTSITLLEKDMNID